MSEHKLPAGWEEKDIREIIPAEAVQVVVTFCCNTLRDSKKPGFDPNDIPRKAKALLEPHKAAFEAVGTDVGFFSYMLQHVWNLGQYEQVVDVLKRPLPKPKQVSLEDILPPEGISSLRMFLENCQRRTLIIEPGKPYVILMYERVVEPYKDYIEKGKDKHGITDLHYFAVALCKMAGIPADECPS